MQPQARHRREVWDGARMKNRQIGIFKLPAKLFNSEMNEPLLLSWVKQTFLFTLTPIGLLLDNMHAQTF